MKCVFYSVIVAAALARAQIQAQIEAQAQQTPAVIQGAPATKAAGIHEQKSDSSPFLPSADMGSREPEPTELLVGYALNVDGLLISLGDQMRTVSEKVEAGELTDLEAVVLKLELTRTMIARLQTVSAVYDSLIFSDVKTDATPDKEPADSTAAPVVLQTKRTISVQELMQENAK